MNKLTQIQKELKAPKNQYNNFGKYKYRNCEDILEAVKPLLNDCSLTLTDEIVMIGARYYVKAIATFTEGEKSITVSAFARESENKKGMDDSQITGSASSYARKYALNGLFLIDDTKDSDAEKLPVGQPPKNKPSINDMPEDVKILFKLKGYNSTQKVVECCEVCHWNWKEIKKRLEAIG